MTENLERKTFLFVTLLPRVWKPGPILRDSRAGRRAPGSPQADTPHRSAPAPARRPGPHALTCSRSRILGAARPLSGPPPGVPPRGSHSRARTPARAATRSWGSRASLPVSKTSARRPFPRAESGGGGGDGRGLEVGPAGSAAQRNRAGAGAAGGQTDGPTNRQARDARPEQRSGRGRASLPLGRAGRRADPGRRRRPVTSESWNAGGGARGRCGQLRPAAGEGARRCFF